MKKFFSVFIIGCLVSFSPCAYAQKWALSKKIFCPIRAKISFYSLQRKTEAAIRRVAAARRVPTASVKAKQSVKARSLKALAPEKSELVAAYLLPRFPFEENDKEIYRGMALDAEGKELRHILQNGLEVAKSHYENFIAYDGKEYPAKTKAIYASSWPDQAETYVLTKANVKNYLPVILHIKKASNRMTVSIPHDIPPSWIYRVSVLLKVSGVLTWGEVRLRNGNFVFYPYSDNP